MYCNSCGSLNKDGQSFCAACGAPLSYQASQPVVPVQPQMYVQPQPVPIQTAVPARPKKSKWAAITGFVLGIITLDLSLLIVFYFPAMITGLAGMTLSVIGFTKKNGRLKPMAIIGAIVSFLGFAFAFLFWASQWSDLAGEILNPIGDLIYSY